MGDTSFERELAGLLNRARKEGDSDTPDYILANFLIGCLQSYESAIRKRDKWHGENRDDRP